MNNRQPPTSDRSEPHGRHYWRSLEEFADSDAFRELMEREFPEQASEWINPVTRRQFLTLMGASLALAGLSGCSTRPAPIGKIMPYVRAPEELVPGRPLFFATAMTLGGIATGVLVESHEGRPTKVEGNPDHPGSLGATDLFAQASVLGLYDPDRSQTVTYLGHTRSWDGAIVEIRTKILDPQGPRRGAGLRILTETVTSPTLADQFQILRKQFPEARWHQYEPAGRDGVLAGARLAFGEPVHTVHDLTKADVVLALDADFLACGPGSVRYAHDFMSRRRVRSGKTEMNRLYVVECTPTNTGAKADHRLGLHAADIERFARALAARLGVKGMNADDTWTNHKWLAPLAADLRPGRSLVLAGDQQPPVVHALAHAINQSLGNVGQTVRYTAPLEAAPEDQGQSLARLVEDMAAGRVEALVIVGGNPVYTAPADLQFDRHLQRVPLRLHLGLYQDETARQCHWHVPEAQYLEAWSDARGYDGTVTVMQPLIAPLYGGKSVHELISVFTNRVEVPGYETVRAYWRRHWQGQGASGTFEDFWQTALHDGVIAGTALPTRSVTLRTSWAGGTTTNIARPSLDNLEILFRPDPTVYDGRFANNGWLQELPKPLTKLTWDNAVLMSPNTAKELGLTETPGWHGGEHGEVEVTVVAVNYQGRTVNAPAWILAGHPDHSVTVHLGHGREFAGRVGNKTGFNVYALRTSRAPWFDTGVKITPTGERFTLACTQYHHLVTVPPAGDRHVVRTGTLTEFQKDPHFATRPDIEEHEENTQEARVPLTLYPPEHQYPGYKWGMVIDLTACVGCKACVVACQAENNIPVVGKEEVTRGREMHWLRIDRYYRGPPENPETYFQPVPCMQCEDAPCELVCPVGATVHSSDGLNDMVYNRCVGTRYCSNNCPYKVRRFNFLEFADFKTLSLKLLHNPDVTVRSRGVMEKCTYCVQRIRRAGIRAKREDRVDPARPGVAPIYDGEVQTACQAACPAGAILFGDMNDPKSRIAQVKAEPHNYGLLGELNTKPRTTYLAAVRNPNPDPALRLE
jgi:molybdopterin-containing oxidoreductase family iron-sulfur binding subunit